MIFSSSSICLHAVRQQLKPQGACARACLCLRNKSKRQSVYEEHHVTETPCTHKKNQVTPRSDQNNNRRACTWACSPTHKHTALLLFPHKHTTSHAAVKSRPLAGFTAFVFSENNLFHPDHVPKHFKASFQKIFSDI